MCALRDRFRQQLNNHGVEYGSGMHSYAFKIKLIKHFGGRITIIDQSGGSRFLCSSDTHSNSAISDVFVAVILVLATEQSCKNSQKRNLRVKMRLVMNTTLTAQWKQMKTQKIYKNKVPRTLVFHDQPLFYGNSHQLADRTLTIITIYIQTAVFCFRMVKL